MGSLILVNIHIDQPEHITVSEGEYITPVTLLDLLKALNDHEIYLASVSYCDGSGVVCISAGSETWFEDFTSRHRSASESA